MYCFKNSKINKKTVNIIVLNFEDLSIIHAQIE